MSLGGEPAGLYVHIPFCSAICPYCDFAVLVGGSDKRQRFVEALLLEIERHADSSFAPVDTIYLGGGTPSLLEPTELERLVGALRATFAPRANAHLYLEANPEDVSPDSLGAWRELGVDTLSLGIQSFDDETLSFLGRRHRGAEARRAVARASSAGFATLSVDLIFGLPGQSEAAWLRDVETAIELAPDHLSCYELEIHSRTTFGKRLARGELTELPGDRRADLFRLTRNTLTEAGYDGYEVSNFAREPSHRSRHNRKYWRHVPYLGLGPSAHSFDGADRWWNERSTPRWERALRSGEAPEAGRETLTREDLALETLMLTLRTREGIDLQQFERRFGYSLDGLNRDLIDRSVDSGLLQLEDSHLRPTHDGLAVADGLAAEFQLASEDATTLPEDRLAG